MPGIAALSAFQDSNAGYVPPYLRIIAKHKNQAITQGDVVSLIDDHDDYDEADENLVFAVLTGSEKTAILQLKTNIWTR